MHSQPTEMDVDLNLPIALRKATRTRVRPRRYDDHLPQPPPPISITLSQMQNENDSLESFLHTITKPLPLQWLETQKNIFGLSRRFLGSLPTSDPDDVEFNDLCDSIHCHDSLDNTSLMQDFSPYPNMNSFLLGNWYWNGGVQKSLESFKSLLGIVSSPNFKPADVCHSQWTRINKVLAAEAVESNNEWEDADAGWTSTAVTIQVPFPAKSTNPGPKSFTVKFHHRRLCNIIREKLELTDLRQFHFQPFELLWLGVRVHGEAYNSPRFIKAYEALQHSPSEPHCSLPRVIVALMFSSDITHLTAWGQASLWPLYLNFGNDSKYRRCKPSCRLYAHVAYFEQVFPKVTENYIYLSDFSN